MNAPDDFGLSPAATIASVAGVAPSPWHTPFWAAWHADLWACSPRLAPHPPSDPSDPGVTHAFESTGRVRIGARLLPARDARGAPTAARAGVVVTHGYADVDALARDEERCTALSRRGVAVLLVRVRGYPGSQLDAGPLERTPTGYITLGLDALMHKPEDARVWVIPQAVADVANACRALQAHLASPGLPDPPIFLRGESFGAGLAVIAAAQLGLAPDPARRVEIARLAIGVPTLGDWPWRLALPDDRVPRAGMNRELRELLIRHAHREAAIADVLGLCDAVIHARLLRAPVLAKLAFRDDLVPAPTQASIFNALATPTGLKRRFVVRYGHYDGGLANARRHAQFESLADDYLDPANDPGL